MPGSTGQADALKILLLTCLLILEMLALPMSYVGTRVPTTHSSGGPKTRPQHPPEPRAPYPSSPLSPAKTGLVQ